MASKRFLARLSMGFSVLDGIFNVPKDLLTFSFGTPSFPRPINKEKTLKRLFLVTFPVFKSWDLPGAGAAFPEPSRSQE